MTLTTPSTGPVESAQRALPARHYTCPEHFARDRRLMLGSWHLAGHHGDLPGPGDYRTLSILDQDILLIRGQDGAIRAFANVCPHRGHSLLCGAGTTRRITCPYHAWSFSTEGALVRQRRRRTTQAPDRQDIGLFELPLAELAGFLFVNPDGTAPPFATLTEGLARQIDETCPGLADLVPEAGPALGHSYACAANWKVLIDNYLECHHCGPAHASFDDLMDIGASRFELFDRFTFQRAPTAGKAENRAFPLDLQHDITVGHFWWLFPNTLLGQFPGVPGFYASRLDPLAPDRTARHTISLQPARPTDPDMARRAKLRSDWSVSVVSREDRALCEAVQRGMTQIAFTQGWYLTDPDAHGISEHAMRHFHRIYLEALAA
ncbi:MAG: aromatic ring-hydroxylating dioxygenase subunit alpha [Pseudomonadota bacterium]